MPQSDDEAGEMEKALKHGEFSVRDNQFRFPLVEVQPQSIGIVAAIGNDRFRWTHPTCFER